MKTYWQKLQDPRWQRKRLEIMERDIFVCRDCGADDKQLQIHHCHYEKGEPWETSNDFLLTVCDKCHKDRQEVEEAVKKSLGIIMAGLRNSDIEGKDGPLKSFAAKVLSCEDLPNGQDIEIMGEDAFHYLSELRWFWAAIKSKKARPFVESIIGKRKWPSLKKDGK